MFVFVCARIHVKLYVRMCSICVRLIGGGLWHVYLFDTHCERKTRNNTKQRRTRIASLNLPCSWKCEHNDYGLLTVEEIRSLKRKIKAFSYQFKIVWRFWRFFCNEKVYKYVSDRISLKPLDPFATNRYQTQYSNLIRNFAQHTCRVSQHTLKRNNTTPHLDSFRPQITPNSHSLPISNVTTGKNTHAKLKAPTDANAQRAKKGR